VARRDDDPRGSRLLVCLTLATWIASLATVAVFVSLWRLGRPAPSAVWAIGSVLAVGVPAMVALLFGLWRFVWGPRRMASLALALLATTPVAWAGAYAGHMIRQSLDRQVPWTVPARIAAFWACSV
jgi:hypothetical protein